MSLHAGAHGGSGKRARIEIIPLIDIIFFLLATFIMVSLSMSKNQGVQVQLPTASTAASLGDQQDLDKAVTLTVTAKGDVFYNKDKITLAQLPLKLQTLKSTSKDPKVILNSDAGADFKHLVAVLDEVRKIGIAKVGINTDKKWKLGLVLGIVGTLFVHTIVMLFGGLPFLSDKKDEGTLQQIELLSETDAAPKDKEKKPDPTTEKKEPIETQAEAPPDASQIVRDLETPAVNDAPALDAASLGAIEAALNGSSGGGGEFAEALSFSSGGRIGGLGKAGVQDEAVESAFSLSEIDQKPRAVFQTTPAYPAEMRGRKVEGVVTLIFVVGSEGKVADPRVEKSSNPAFDAAALDAVRRWKFEPAIKAGQRVACKMRVPIRFQPNG